MESGADESLVPTRDWTLDENFRSAPGEASRVIRDIHGLIWAEAPSPALAPLISSLVTEVSMNRRVGARVVAGRPVGPGVSGLPGGSGGAVRREGPAGDAGSLRGAALERVHLERVYGSS